MQNKNILFENIITNVLMNNNVNIDLDTILTIAKRFLETQSLDTNKKLTVKEIYLYESKYIICEFYTNKENSIDIKGDIAFISSTLYIGLIDFLGVFKIKAIGVKAFSVDNEMILSGLSNLKALEELKLGNEIYYINGTLFNDFTESNRLTIVKGSISQIENAIRKLIIHQFALANPNDWWTVKINEKIRKKAENSFENQNSKVSNIGEELIFFTTLLDLKKIICNDWLLFKQYLCAKIKFETTMDNFNKIRRNEAHNRIISMDEIHKISAISSILLDPIVNHFPNLAPEYLERNYKRNLYEIFVSHPIYDVTKETGPNYKSYYLEHYSKMESELNNITTKLKSLQVPCKFSNLHENLVSKLTNLKLSYRKMKELIPNGQLVELENAVNDLKKSSEKLSKVRIQILKET